MIIREWYIAKTVLIEAVRRKEVYVLVLLSCVLIAAVTAIDFFNLEGLTKFYREFALKVMSASTAAATIILACRQLPRELEMKTVYPLLARPLSRSRILLGKFLGVWLASIFCMGLFSIIYAIGVTYLDGELYWGLFSQYVSLQLILMLLLGAFGFVMSMVCTAEASITLGLMLYLLGTTLSSMINFMYDVSSTAAQWAFVILTYLIPQLSLFDLSEKTVHAEVWDPLSAVTVLQLTVYALAYILLFMTMAIVLFRKRSI